MENKYKFLIPLLMTFLMAGFVSAMDVEIVYVGLNPQPETEDIPSHTGCCFGDMCRWIHYCDVGEGAIEPENYIVEPGPVDLYVGEIVEDIVIEPTSTIELITSGKGKETFEVGYDCYHQSSDLYWGECKQVEHKVSWFEKKGFHQGWFCEPYNGFWMCRFVDWIRYPKA